MRSNSSSLHERAMQKQVKTVAVVDDDPSMLKAAADLLDARGFSVSLFTSAEEFLDSDGLPTGGLQSLLSCSV